MIKKLKEFYGQYFNNNFFRDADYIRGEWYSPVNQEPKHRTDRVRYLVKNCTPDLKSMGNFKRKFKYFLVNKKHRDGTGQLLHYNSYFNTVPDFHSDITDDRLYDRLFYDIDKHDDTIDGFKDSLKQIKLRPIGSDAGYSLQEKLKDIQDVQEQYRNYIIRDNDGNFLADPYSDVLKIKKYYNDRGVNPVISFTGGAGFHINILFEPVHLFNPSDVFLSYNNLIMNKTGVNSLDDAPPKNAIKGTQRTPYSVHEKSGLTGFIIPDDTTYDDLMTIIERNKLKVNDFSYDDHIVPDLLREQIIKMDKLAGQKKVEKREQQEKKYKSRLNRERTLYIKGIGNVTVGNEYNNSLSDDLRHLWDLMVIDGAVHPPKDKDIREHYNRVRCPFPDHEDKNPSSICGKHRFKCFKCCPDGINWYMLIAVTYGIISPDDIKKDVPQDKRNEIKKIINRLQHISPDE